jgi:hypothetical protein
MDVTTTLVETYGMQQDAAGMRTEVPERSTGLEHSAGKHGG